jgi:predicted dehydrogenase
MHVLIEKPMAGSVGETRELIRLADHHNRRILPVHQCPFQRGFQRFQQQRDLVGDIVRLTYHACSAGGMGLSDVERQQVLREILPHPASLFCSLLGERYSKSSWNVLTFTSNDLWLAGMADGVQLDLWISMRGRPVQNELTVVGTKGTAYIDLFHGSHLLEIGSATRREKILRPMKHGFQLLYVTGTNLMRRLLCGELAYPGLGNLIGMFYRSIKEHTPAPIHSEEMIEAALLMERIQEASA